MGRQFDFWFGIFYTGLIIGAGAGIARVTGAPGPALIIAGLIFLLVREGHTTLLRGRERRQHAYEIQELKRELAHLRGEQSKWAEAHSNSLRGIERELNKRRDRLMSEFKLMEQVLRKVAPQHQGGNQGARLESDPESSLESRFGGGEADQSPPAAPSANPPKRSAQGGGAEGQDRASLGEMLRKQIDFDKPAQSVYAPPGIGFTQFSGLTTADPFDPLSFAEVIEAAETDLLVSSTYNFESRAIDFFVGEPVLKDLEGSFRTRRELAAAPGAEDHLSSIDNLLLFRSVQAARQIALEAPDRRLVVPLQETSIQDRGFWPQFLEFLSFQESLTETLLFAVSQSFLRRLDRVSEAHLMGLVDRQFKLALTNVDDLTFDLIELKSRNVRAMLLSSDVFPHGVPELGSSILAADLCRLLDRHGICLLIGGIADEETLLEVIDHEVRYGFGPFFGRPRPFTPELNRTDPFDEEGRGARA